MRYVRFTTPDEGDIFVNMDRIVAIRPFEENFGLMENDTTCVALISEEQLHAFLREENDESIKDLQRSVRKLTESVDRLTVKIPTSIRMHL